MNPALVSAIMPTLDEATVLAGSLQALRMQEGLRELVVVDGGSRDATKSVVAASRPEFAGRGIDLAWVEDKAGRAAQMNAGAARASGEILLFVHADTHLPDGAVPAIARSIREGHVGGAFHHRFIEPGVRLAGISFWANLRSGLTHLFFGDQAIFVRKDLFDLRGGFRLMPIMEDLEFSSRLRARGATRFLPMSVRTSARRFLSAGLGATCARMVWLRTSYRLGAAPVTLKRHYPEVR